MKNKSLLDEFNVLENDFTPIISDYDVISDKEMLDDIRKILKILLMIKVVVNLLIILLMNK